MTTAEIIGKLVDRGNVYTLTVPKALINTKVLDPARGVIAKIKNLPKEKHISTDESASGKSLMRSLIRFPSALSARFSPSI